MIASKNKPKVLVCDDHKNIHLALKAAFGTEYDIKSAYTSEEALVIVKKNRMDLILLDMEIEHIQSGLEIIPKLLQLQEDLKIIVFSGHPDFNLVKKAILAGASDYIIKDAGPAELDHVLKKALHQQQSEKKTQQSQFELKRQHATNSMIGKSPAIQKIKKQIEKARNSPAPVLIFGETGTGKEVVARALRRTLADGTLEPFVAIDSATIQSSVAESVLFGYEKGAFTGAEKTTRGLFEEADGGTVYFDELANMPLEIQNKLLRVVQEKEILRIGSAKPIELEFRVIGATNQDLEELVRQGKFKEDLYQRLCVLQIDVPPLRERVEDIPDLLEYFSELHRGQQTRITFLPETMSLLKNYAWPGNIREVSNLVLYLYTMMEGDQVSPLDLPPKLSKKITPLKPSATEIKNFESDHSKNFYDAVEEFEQRFLQDKYSQFEGNVSKMASALQMDRSYLHGKLKNFGIHSVRKLDQ